MIASLEFFRIIAFIAIFIHHLRYPFLIAAPAVSMFFVLSGFLSAYNYYHAFSSIGIDKVKSFYLARISRIYPVYLLTLLIGYFLSFLTNFKAPLIQTILHVTMLQAWFPQGKFIFAYNGVSWFVSSLFFFFLITPWVLFLLNKSYKQHTLIKLIGSIAIVYYFYSIFALGIEGEMVSYSINWWLTYISPYFRICDYIIGIFTGIAFIELKPLLASRNNKIIFSVLEIGSLLLLYKFYLASLTLNGYWVLSGYYALPSAIIILIYAFQKGYLSNRVNNSLTIFFGKLTFSAYMIHLLIMQYIEITMTPAIYGLNPDPKHIAAQIVIFTFSICAAIVIHLYCEIPLKNIFTKSPAKNKALV